MKGKQRRYVAVGLTFSILFLSFIFLFVQNNHYRNENRKLILENDSVKSVNIHLRELLENRSGADLSIK